MRLPDARYCRLGLGLLFSALVFACLNPRPDDQPLAQPVGSDPSTQGTGAPPPRAGFEDDGDSLLGSEDGTTDGEASGPVTAAPGVSLDPALGTDAGVPDAGPLDAPDAGAPDD